MKNERGMRGQAASRVCQMIDLSRAGGTLALVATLAASGGAGAQEAAAPAAAGQDAEKEQAVALVSGGVQAKADADPSCPQISLEPKAGTFPPRDDSFKATLQGLARDCANLGAETILKVAVIGEGERDSKKGPSWFNAPLKVSVKDAEGRPVETRKIKLKVTLPNGLQKVSFNHVESDVSLPPPPPGGYRDWMVVVGFDPAGQPAKKDVSKAARKAAVKRAVRTARAAPPPLPPAPGVGTSGAAPVPPVTTRTTTSGETNFSRLARDAAERKTQAQTAVQQAAAQQAAQRQPAQRRQAANQPARARPATPARQQVAARPAPMRTAESN